MTARLCFNAIVRNEAANLPRCLASIAPHIACWSIADTGSTDGTQELVERFFAERGIPGRLHQVPFLNFGQARNEALALARFDGGLHAFDYLLLADADMELVGAFADGWDAAGAPAYQLLQRNPQSGLAYWNTRLVRCDAAARYVGATHEYVEVAGHRARLDAPIFLDHASGSNRAGKFARDVELLEAELNECPGAPRPTYYLAQSYRDLGQHQKAAQLYRARAGMGGWAEEAWSARLNEARCYRALGDEPAFIVAALAAYAMRPGRAEPLHDLARHFRLKGEHELSVLYSERGMRVPYPAGDILFVEEGPYLYGLRDEFAVSAYYCADPITRLRGHTVCRDLAAGTGPVAERARDNLRFYDERAQR